MNPLTNVKNLTKMNERELEMGVPENASWHNMYKHSSWIFFGGLSSDLTEGDAICIFSQWGEIVNIHLVRDRITGRSKGYGFICYEDQRSTILAVDNANGSVVCKRVLRVDHCEEYKIPKNLDKLDEETREYILQGCAPKPILIKKSEDKKKDYIKKEDSSDRDHKKKDNLKEFKRKKSEEDFERDHKKQDRKIDEYGRKKDEFKRDERREDRKKVEKFEDDRAKNRFDNRNEISLKDRKIDKKDFKKYEDKRKMDNIIKNGKHLDQRYEDKFENQDKRKSDFKYEDKKNYKKYEDKKDYKRYEDKRRDNKYDNRNEIRHDKRREDRKR